MAKCYFELRKQSAKGTDSIAADIMRHLHARQHLGKAVIICDQPIPMLAAARKQWLKLTRTIQKQRSSTLNADKILKYTHTITHMQHLRFTHKTPLDDPEADIYFIEPTECATMPAHCFTIYVMPSPAAETILPTIEQVPSEALVVDYDRQTSWASYGLQSKVVLEEQVESEWRQVLQFLENRNIAVDDLQESEHQDIELLDNALDSLLGVSHQFLRIANEFQRALELARPLRVSQSVRKHFDTIVLLAYRVQALSPGAFTQHFLETYNEDDTFFLYDVSKQYRVSLIPLAEEIERHIRAGRHNLAEAIRLQASLQPARTAAL
ncbi:MAG TPA: hypothetical protein VFT16_01110 [Candidatus Saccharimonadales bacterium]|nr:hypothetical protein [Candidatus Saccharimonadales bacterium]